MITIYYGAPLSPYQWPRGLGITNHKSHFTAELILLLRGIYSLFNMSLVDPDGSHFIQLVCLVTFIFFPFEFCCQFFLPWSELTDLLMLEKRKTGRQLEEITNETVKSVCVYYLVLDGLPEGEKQSGNFHSPPPRPPPLRPTGHAELVSIMTKFI